MARRKLSAEEIQAGFSIDKVVARVAYARNGNAGNPTKEYNYLVRRGGKPCSSPAPRLRDAIGFVEDAMRAL